MLRPAAGENITVKAAKYRDQPHNFTLTLSAIYKNVIQITKQKFYYGILTAFQN